MLHEMKGVPPAIPLLLSEVAHAKTWDDARKRVKGLLKELRIQSESYLSSDAATKGSKRNSGAFRMHLHGALDLFNGGGCSELPCRLEATDRLARSVGLIADEIWLTDTFSINFLSFGRATNRKIDSVVADVIVLTRLLPLIQAGIVKFRPSVLALCSDCYGNFETQVESIAQHLVREFRKDFRVRDRADGGYFVETGRCFDPPLMHHSAVSDGARPTARYYAEEIVTEEVRSALWAARDASISGGSVLSNSRVGLAALLRQEGRLVSRGGLLRLEQERDISVPWVSSLEPHQIVQLREEASKALPSFRSAMARALAFSDNKFEAKGAPSAVIAELREQADLVREELSARRGVSARYWRTTYALLGLGLSAYGVAADQPLAGVAGLLPLIQLLIEHRTGHEAEVAMLEHRPGYVLVKAQQLLQHAHDQAS